MKIIEVKMLDTHLGYRVLQLQKEGFSCRRADLLRSVPQDRQSAYLLAAVMTPRVA